jgi:3-hydroxyacyl-CoA dehydrogenase/enoyl-CoA hydratase/3-hydroxybutyryl-CoA epimerase
MTYKHWTIERDKDNICWLHFNKADTSTNVLSSEVLNELHAVLDAAAQPQPKGMVFVSDKKNGFIAGADITEFTTIKDHGEAMDFLRRGHDIMNRIEAMKWPTVAMIKGFCLGGGMELALACTYRICCDDAGTRVGLPEIKLGIHPGFGGTVRSIQNAGVLAAMDIMLTGRTLQGRQAKKMGLVDEVVPERQLKRAAIYFIEKRPRKQPLGFIKTLPNFKLLRPLVAMLLRKQVSAKARKEHYPAPYKLIELWQQHMSDPALMLQKEAESVASLVTDYTARNLVRVFQLQETLKSLGKKGDFEPRHVHVIGGGVMGGDIAAWCALRGFNVTVQDQKPEMLAQTMKRSLGMFQKKFKKDKRAIQQALDRLMADHKGLGVKHADVIIEAIFEDKDVKQKLFQSIEPHMKADAILATNTSSIPLEQLATCLKNPGRLVGIHFFNPVALMPLVEIVRGANTDETVVKKALAFGRQIDKLPLPVKSTPGFLVNRILMPYLLEAVELYSEGVAPEAIDQAALNFGMPMGPIELADTVGLDVCRSVAKILSETLKVKLPAVLDTMVNNKKLGKKSGEGFYKWVKGKPQKHKPAEMDLSEIQDRLILRLLNEATACLREKVVDSVDLVDAGVIFGTGFAPFRGGPLHHVQAEGASKLSTRLDDFKSRFGERFTRDDAWNQL